MSRTVFLATTSLESPPDSEMPVVFLGPWCERYESPGAKRKIEADRMPSPFADSDSVDAAYRECRKVFEAVLPSVGRALNGIHGTDHQDRYWRILVGPWLQFFIFVVYDRFVHLAMARKLYPGFTTLGLDSSSFVTPKDSLDFIFQIKSDRYNLQLYTQILQHAGIEFPVRVIAGAPDTWAEMLARVPVWRRWARGITSLWQQAAAKSGGTVGLYRSYFPARTAWSFVAKSPRRIVPILLPRVDFSDLKVNGSLREALTGTRIQGEFGSVLGRLIASHMPIAYVEGYRRLTSSVDKTPKPTTIFSANGWHYDEPFKAWSGAAAQGSRLVGTNHGANYGSHVHVFGEDHELSIVDRYYSWGWSRSDFREKIVPFWSTKMAGRSKASTARSGILWAATIYPRYLTQFPEIPVHFEAYLSWQLRFLSALGSDLAHVRFRPHREDAGWGVEARVRDAFPSIRVERWDDPFETSLRRSRVYVCDHLSTTFAEALALNHPTILFWDPAIQRLRPEARPAYDRLARAGILHFSPEKAAQAVSSAYKDVASWWSEPERQAAVREFGSAFARNSESAVDDWHNELVRMATGRP